MNEHAKNLVTEKAKAVWADVEAIGAGTLTTLSGERLKDLATAIVILAEALNRRSQVQASDPPMHGANVAP
jgi:hypothetical protein